MNRGIQDATACREALSRLPTLDIGQLRQQWRGLYKTQAPANLSRELLLRAVAYRMQEVALGGLRPARQRQLRQMAQQFNRIGASYTPPRPELKPGTRLMRGALFIYRAEARGANDGSMRTYSAGTRSNQGCAVSNSAASASRVASSP
jgi:hypothetical protein